jgi:hypothetical protein
MKSFDIVTVSGDLDAMTSQLSLELVKRGAKKVIAFRRKTVGDSGIKINSDYEELLFDIEKVAKEKCYECWLESKKLGDKIGVLPGEVIAYSGFSDFKDLLKIKLDYEECSAFLMRKNIKSWDWIACGQTWDTKKFYEKHSVFIRRFSNEGYKTLVLTTLLGHAYFGINEKGVGIIIQNLRSKDVAIGLPFSLIVYKALSKSSTALDAMEIIRNIPRMSGHNYIIVDQSGSCFNLEASANYTSVIDVSNDDFLVHTNHNLNSKSSKYIVHYSQTSCQRQKYLHDKLRKIGNELKDDELKTLFSDHSVPVCRHGSSDDDVTTIGAVWLKPHYRSVVAINGYPCVNKCKEYKLEVGK